MERYIWTTHPYVAYTMVDKLFNPLTLLVGPCLVAHLMYKSTLSVEHGGYHLPWWNILASYLVWLLATRTGKLLPHLWHNPSHVIFVPAFIIFGYYFSIMKMYALFTLHETGWGTRAGIGDASAATAAADQANLDEKTLPQQPPPPSGTYRHTPTETSPFADPQLQLQQQQPYSPYDPYGTYTEQPHREISPFNDPLPPTMTTTTTPYQNVASGGARLVNTTAMSPTPLYAQFQTVTSQQQEQQQLNANEGYGKGGDWAFAR